MTTDRSCIRCTDPAVIRGLCRKHYAQFTKAKKKAEDNGIPLEQFEAALIEKKLLLPNAKQAADAYEQTVDELCQERKRGVDPGEVDHLTDQIKSRKGPDKRKKAE